MVECPARDVDVEFGIDGDRARMAEFGSRRVDDLGDRRDWLCSGGGQAAEGEEDEAAVEDSLAADDGDMAFFQLANTRYIHQETKDYVPKLIAAAMIAKQPERYGFAVPMGGPPALDSLVLTDATGFEHHAVRKSRTSGSARPSWAKKA